MAETAIYLGMENVAYGSQLCQRARRQWHTLAQCRSLFCFPSPEDQWIRQRCLFNFQCF
jgi:hypothetical protein